jgi:hypothetical protein
MVVVAVDPTSPVATRIARATPLRHPARIIAMLPRRESTEPPVSTLLLSAGQLTEHLPRLCVHTPGKAPQCSV